MVNNDFELLTQYRKLITDYEVAKGKYEEACNIANNNRRRNLERFHASHRGTFRNMDEKQLTGPNSKGLIAATVLTGGLAAPFLANRIKKEKQAQEWNQKWEERYYAKYKYEIEACKEKDIEQSRCDNEKIKEASNVMKSIKDSLDKVSKEIMLPESLRMPNRIDVLLSYFNSGKASTVEEAMALYEPVLKREEEERRIAEEEAERKRRKLFEEEMLKKQEEQQRLLEELSRQNSSLQYDNEQLSRQLDNLSWRLNDLS